MWESADKWRTTHVKLHHSRGSLWHLWRRKAGKVTRSEGGKTRQERGPERKECCEPLQGPKMRTEIHAGHGTRTGSWERPVPEWRTKAAKKRVNEERTKLASTVPATVSMTQAQKTHGSCGTQSWAILPAIWVGWEVSQVRWPQLHFPISWDVMVSPK